VIRVLIVDDHPLIRGGLTAMLNNAGDIRVAGTCTNDAEVADMVRSARPDVVLMDAHLRRVSDPPATPELLALGTGVRVLMMSASMAARSVSDAAAAGAVGYVLKGGQPNALIDAIRTVAAGGTAWPDRADQVQGPRSPAPVPGEPDDRGAALTL
jgi:DNA-binding NarL/FixJ family response regulator